MDVQQKNHGSVAGADDTLIQLTLQAAMRDRGKSHLGRRRWGGAA